MKRLVTRKSAAGQSFGISPNKLSAKQALAKLEADNDPFWLNAKKEAYRSVSEIKAQDEFERAGGAGLKKLRRGDRTRHEIALTFDDGPHSAFTPRILEILNRENVTATFFVVGTQAEAHPELIRAEAESGHLVANHTYHHVSLTKIPLKYVAEEIQACGDVIRRVLGKTAKFFRPPGGDYDVDVARVANSLGYTVVLWTADPLDFSNPGEKVIYARTLARVSNGGIILLHDGVQQTVDVLPTIIETLKAKGFKFVTVDQLERR